MQSNPPEGLVAAVVQALEQMPVLLLQVQARLRAPVGQVWEEQGWVNGLEPASAEMDVCCHKRW